MSWTYRFDRAALRELKKLDRTAQREIIRYLDERITGTEDPRRFGKALKAQLSGLWRYRVRDFRIICQIQDGILVVLVLAVSHRKAIYR